MIKERICYKLIYFILLFFFNFKCLNKKKFVLVKNI